MRPDQTKFLFQKGLETHSGEADTFEFRSITRAQNQRTGAVDYISGPAYFLSGKLGTVDVEQSDRGDSFFITLDAVTVDARVIVNQSDRVLLNGENREIKMIREIKQANVTVQQVVILAQ